MRCFLDSNDEVTSICDARFIVIQSKCEEHYLLNASVFARFLSKIFRE